MSEELEIWVKISQQIGEISAEIKGVLEKLANHEQRLTTLELHKGGGEDWKTTLLMLLAKSTIIGLVVIGGLAGVGDFLKSILK